MIPWLAVTAIGCAPCAYSIHNAHANHGPQLRRALVRKARDVVAFLKPMLLAYVKNDNTITPSPELGGGHHFGSFTTPSHTRPMRAPSTCGEPNATGSRPTHLYDTERLLIMTPEAFQNC